MSDPHRTTLPTSELTRMAAALDVLDEQAVLNPRYKKLIEDSRSALASEEVRLTQARGIAKKVLVLVKAAGPNFRSRIAAEHADAIDAGLAQANELIFRTD